MAIAAAFAVYFIYTTVYNKLAPLPDQPEPAAATTATQPAAAASPATQAAAQPTTAPQPGAVTQPASAPGFAFAQADSVQRFTIGGGPEDRLQLDLTSLDSAVESIKLTEQKDGKFVRARDAETNEPYVLITPVKDTAGREFSSYRTPLLNIGEINLRMDGLHWEVVSRGERAATFGATLRSPDGGDQLRITKTYEIQPASAAMRLKLRIENLGDTPLAKVNIEQDGPIGIIKEHLTYDMRKLVRARRVEGDIEPKAWTRANLAKTIKNGAEDIDLGSSADEFLWTALTNKYFAVFTRPLPRDGAALADYVADVRGTVGVANPAEENPGDYLARMFTTPGAIEPHAAVEYQFEIYAGTKNQRFLEHDNPDYVDRTKIGYIAAADADTRCCVPVCNSPALTLFMIWSIDAIQTIVRNYGIAIIILVLIVRTLLHPLTVFQQKSMYKMQEAQARIKPKIDAIKEKFPNDKQKQNQEQMKLYGEEGVNPMAPMVGMLPMLLQMPILIALWTALNTDVSLRHVGFDPWWITDLSAPDEFIKFAHPITIPILGQLPLIGRMFTGIPSINVLPLLMGVSMWLQQKYMPKPGMQAKADAAKKAAAEKKPAGHTGGKSLDDQMRQQQMMAYMMSIMFPLMFYYWPSGLNLYWFSTNVFGIAESLVIRKQIKRDKERRDAEGPKPPPGKKAPGPIARFMKRMSERAEEVQRKADQLSQDPGKRPGPPKGRGR